MSYANCLGKNHPKHKLMRMRSRIKRLVKKNGGVEVFGDDGTIVNNIGIKEDDDGAFYGVLVNPSADFCHWCFRRNGKQSGGARKGRIGIYHRYAYAC